MPEKPYIIANWKMNLDGSAVERFMNMFPVADPLVAASHVLIAPSYVFIPAVRAAVPEKEIAVAGQDLYWEDRGAFTGAVSARQLADAGCSYVIIGHSERRAFFGETDEAVNRKVHAALSRRLRPIICFGESYAEKEAGETKRVIYERIVAALQDVRSADARRILLAYEPLWAISTSTELAQPVSDTPESAQVIHKLIRRTIADLYDAHVATEMRIIYGGSVDEKNVAGFAAMDDIDGVLVGGASVDPQSFFRVIQAYHSSPR
ncbi:MAG: triose-phosphate isomerase [Candidatus Kerfeldbacteria bacterium]|nr:triose-phosphate isomerase [Candidatus Kerfeldbacteria bacterium]